MQIQVDIPIPTIPSNQYIFSKPNRIEIRVKVVIIQSFLWSFIFAFNNKLLFILYNLSVYKNSDNLVIIVMKQTKTNIHENVNFVPKIKFVVESYNNLKAIIIIERLIKSEKIYKQAYRFGTPVLCH